jgi:hypothetical protein
MVNFNEKFAEILGEGLPYTIFDNENNNFEIRCYGEDGNTVRMIQYQFDDNEFRILSLNIADEPRGGNHILRIAAESADLFKSEGFKKIKGNDFTSTDAGLSFQSKTKNINSYEEGNFTVLDIDDFQKLKEVKQENDTLKQGAK